MKVIAVLNRDGGTFSTLDLDAFCAMATEIFGEAGHQLECRPVAGAEIMKALQAAAAEPGTDLLLAGGGDGTISGAAKVAFETKMPLAVLPAGTMNLFARSLGLPLDLEDALRAVAQGELAKVDIATVNGEPFVHQFSVGIHARLVRIRDGMTYNGRIGKMLAGLRAISSALIDPPRFDVEVEGSRGVEKRQTSGITVSNNPFGEGHIPYADHLDEGVLGVYIARPMTSGELARLTAGVLLGHWQDSSMISEREVTRITLRFPHRKRSAQAVVDGELIDLDREIKIVLHPGALRVMTPKAPSPHDKAK